MAKRCGFCSFRTDDDSAFAVHVASVHGFRPAPRSAAAGPAIVPVSGGVVVYCYSCGAANPSGAPVCAQCHAVLTLTERAHVFGRSYVLNHLPGLVAAGVLDDASAARVRGAILGNASARPTTPVAAAPAAAPTPGPTVPVDRPISRPDPYAEPVPTRPAHVEPAGPGLFSPERAPSLLLYVGAFLIVVSALIFVNVSGEQISDSAKLALMLVGTIAFIAGGLVCHRVPRVLEAGRTFLLIGALLTPLDFAAYYVLIVHASPLTTPEMWILGSLVSAVLYAALALTSFGRAYAYLFFLATLSALAAVDVRFDARAGWAFVPFVLFAIALELADHIGPERLGTISGPLSRPSRILAAVAIAGGVAASVGPAPSRWALSAIVAVGTLYYAIRSATATVEWERWAVVVGPAALAAAVVYDIRGAAQTYGFVSAVVAISYGVAGDIAGLGTPIRVPAWITSRARVVTWGAVAGALLPASSYWRAPSVGAFVNLAMAGFLGAAAALRARAHARSGATSTVDLSPYVLVGAVALHMGVLFAALSLGIIQGGASEFTGLVPREMAILFAPVAASLAVLTGLARARARALEASLALVALISAAAVVAFAYVDPELETLLATLAAAGVVAGALVSRRPQGLWIAAVFGAAAVVGLDRWVVPPVEWRPLALAAISLVLFVPAYLRLRNDNFGRVSREIALVAVALSVVVGLSEAAMQTSRMTEVANWLATIPTFLVFGSLGVAEGLHRRSERGVLLATTCFLAAVLMIVARFRPDPLEAYSWPVAIYLAAVASGIALFGSDRLRASLLVPAQVASAVVLLGSSLAVMPARGDVTRAALVMGEALVIIRYAAGRASIPLATTALAFLALMLYRSSVTPLVLETVSMVFGVLMIALALAVPRWVPWRLPTRWLEATELAGALMVVVPPLVRAGVGAPDALEHGVTVLAAGWIIALVGVWGGRRALLSAALSALALVGVLALRDAARTELYVGAAGGALLALAFAIPRVLPRRLPIQFEWLTEAVAVGLILSGPLLRTFRDGADAPSRALAESLTLIALGVIAARPALTVAALATVGIEAAWIIADPRARQFHGIVVGAYLMAVALAALRYRRDRIDSLVLLAMEAGGAFLFIAPTLVAGWDAEFYPLTVMVFVEIFLVMGVGIVLHRRWLVAGALAALGLETIRGAIDVVNRLPNWALFGASGAILLAIGFVLLLKRDAWNAWSRSMFKWWARL